MTGAETAAERACAVLRTAPLDDPAYDDLPWRPAPARPLLPEPGVPETGVPGAGELGAPVASRWPAGAVTAALRQAGETAWLGAFVCTFPGAADHAAVLAGQPSRGPLHGCPVAVKDLIDVAGQPVRSGTPGLAHREPGADAPAWQLLAAAGAVLIGRTRSHELGWGVTTPGCANPWAPGRSAGGSSGGSAVAVAAGVVPIALGTDTGGSIRIPAALCGVAGLRPTTGVVSCRGITPLAPSMDTVGAIALTAGECLLVHGLLGGTVTSVPATAAGLRVGWPAGLWSGRVQPAVTAALGEAAGTLRAAGAEIAEVDLPLAARYARQACYVIMLAESAALWYQALLAQPSGLSGQTAELLRAGAAVSAADYLQARRVASAIQRELDETLRDQRLAAVLLPTVPVTAAPADADTVDVGGRAEPVSSAYSRLAALASVTGHPALTVPAGLGEHRLPVGAQLIGARHGESLLCLLGEVIERGPGGRAVSSTRPGAGFSLTTRPGKEEPTTIKRARPVPPSRDLPTVDTLRKE